MRERQAAASLGLPSRIRDEDCDVESLSPSDLELDETLLDPTFGSCQQAHVTYVTKMVEISRLRTNFSALLPLGSRHSLLLIIKSSRQSHRYPFCSGANGSLTQPCREAYPRPRELEEVAATGNEVG